MPNTTTQDGEVHVLVDKDDGAELHIVMKGERAIARLNLDQMLELGEFLVGAAKIQQSKRGETE